MNYLRSIYQSQICHVYCLADTVTVDWLLHKLSTINFLAGNGGYVRFYVDIGPRFAWFQLIYICKFRNKKYLKTLYICSWIMDYTSNNVVLDEISEPTARHSCGFVYTQNTVKLMPGISYCCNKFSWHGHNTFSISFTCNALIIYSSIWRNSTAEYWLHACLSVWVEMSSSAICLFRAFCCICNQPGESDSSSRNKAKKKMERIEIVESEEHVVKRLIQYIEEKAKVAIAERNRFVIGLSGINIYLYVLVYI